MRTLAAVFVLLAMAACSTLHNADAPPGGTVTKTTWGDNDLAQFWFGNHLHQHSYQRVRLIAPLGAFECGVDAFHGGPQREGLPNERREVDVTVRSGVRHTEFYCKTPQGVIRRTVDAVEVFRHTYEGGSRHMEIVLRKFPMLVHVGGADAESEARWTALHAEVCTITPLPSDFQHICEDANFAALRAADIGS